MVADAFREATSLDAAVWRERMESITSLGPFLVPITAIIVGGAIAIVVLILRHQERIAKIERGIDPDGANRK
jgi:NhaP-type Na+/H+ or K+/H+ antiporter